MITFERNQGMVTIAMPEADFEGLCLILGYAAGAAHGNSDGDMAFFHAILRFINDLNAGNPQYRPYRIPEGE